MRESKVRLFLADRRRSDKDIPPSTRVRPRSKSVWIDRSDRVGFAANSLKETKQFSQNCDSVLLSSVSSLSAVYFYSTQWGLLLFEIKQIDVAEQEVLPPFLRKQTNNKMQFTLSKPDANITHSDCQQFRCMKKAAELQFTSAQTHKQKAYSTWIGYKIKRYLSTAFSYV